MRLAVFFVVLALSFSAQATEQMAHVLAQRCKVLGDEMKLDRCKTYADKMAESFRYSDVYRNAGRFEEMKYWTTRAHFWLEGIVEEFPEVVRDEVAGRK